MVLGRRLGAIYARFADHPKWSPDVGRLLDDALAGLQGRATGLPTLHADTHKGSTDSIIGSGSPAPISLTGAAAAGTPTLGAAALDHVHAVVGIEKGGLLTGSPNAIHAAGVFPQLLVADEGSATGLYWVQPWEPYVYAEPANNVLFDLYRHACADNEAVAGVIEYSIQVRTAGGVQIEEGRARYIALQFGGAFTPAAVIVKELSSQLVTSGTLAVTWAITTDAALDRVTVQVTANSSLAPAAAETQIGAVIQALDWGALTNVPT